MKRILSMAMTLALTTSQAFSYSTETLKKISDIAGAAQTANAVIGAVSKSGASNELQFMGGLSKEVNTLVSYALMDSGFMPRIARVIERINKETPWQPDTVEINKDFFTSFAISLTRGIAHEARAYFVGKSIAAGLENVSNSRLVARASQALGAALSNSIVETIFERIRYSAGVGGEEAPKCSTVLFSTFAESLASELAYHFAGEVIYRNATDTKSKDLFSDVFGSTN